MVGDLKRRIVGRKIIGLWCDFPRSLGGANVAGLGRIVRGARISGLERFGKNVVIRLIGRGNKPWRLIIHPKMTGHLLMGKWKKSKEGWMSASGGHLAEKVNQFIHFLLKLSRGEMLGLSDVRKFAKITLEEEKEGYPSSLDKLGPDPTSDRFNREDLARILHGKKGKIKQVLMDQAVLSGIGNIYSDEVLWLAKIDPLRRADSIESRELKLLYASIRRILGKAINLRGSSVNNYRDIRGRKGKYAEERLVYRRTGDKCPRCGAGIRRIKIGGRSAHFCPSCQK